MIWLSPRRLDWALRTRGTDLASWPAAERAAALSLMRRCSRARAVMADALANEDAPQPHASVAQDAALLACLQGRLRARLVARPPGPPAVRWGALAACALAGLYLGLAVDQDADAFALDVFAYMQSAAIDAAL